MRRQRRPVVLRLPAADGGTAGRELVRHAERRLWVKVRGDGRVRARFGTATRYSTPPVLVGRILVADGGVELTGSIREPWTEVLVPRLFVGVALFLGGVCAAILATGEFGSPGVYVCGIGGAVIGLIGVALGRLRRAAFEERAERLEQAVRAAAWP